MRFDPRKLILLTLVALLALLVVGCGGGGSSTSSESTGAASEAEAGGEAEAETEAGGEAEAEGESGSVLGKEDKATGEPIVVGMLNLENGPVTFPQYKEATEAAIEYVNIYKGGIHGRPLELVECATDGQPATSTRCANQIVEKNPAFILGAADTGASGAFPVYERKGLAYIGGMPLTPTESNAKNAATFISIAVADNAAAAAFAKETLGVKSAASINTSDTQGKYTGSIIQKSLEGAGLKVDYINVSPTASDLTSPAAEAVTAGSELVYIQVPNACAPMLKALESVGNTAPIISVGTCSAPSVLEAAGPAAEEIYFPEPVELLSNGSEQAEITNAAFDEWTSSEMPRETFAVEGFAAVMNVWETLNEAPESDLQSAKILAQFTTGGEHPNWLAHPYTCNRKQVPAQEAVCNGYQKMTQVKEGAVVEVTKDWVNGTKYYTP
jgi:branched-chain amino acid transport system substrate-binding protein